MSKDLMTRKGLSHHLAEDVPLESVRHVEKDPCISRFLQVFLYEIGSSQ
ncbi:hypothetical protein MM221_08860 [Salipaludibacillus sp. LMS25]|jgi:hypothetical protein|nr:hypothetical protein [Salipaludibacillus sp. LMS25]UTR16617.1 hypothetical protein MM221_08860 [Salipaludibacillus sp. LMS25]